MIETTRLKLVPLSHEQLLLYKNDLPGLAKELGIEYMERQYDPAVATDLAEALEFWIRTTAANRFYQWTTNWEVISKGENISVGGIGFAGYPDPDGKTAVGYGLDVRFHGNGYATEALAGLLKWGFGHPVLRMVTAETSANHVASQRVLIKNGFIRMKSESGITSWILTRQAEK